jgi:hypothetical protein
MDPNVLQLQIRSQIPIHPAHINCVTGSICNIELSTTPTNNLPNFSLMRVVLPPELKISSGYCKANTLDGVSYSC